MNGESKRTAGEVRFVAASDQSLLVVLGDRISPEASARVARLVRLLEQQPIGGVRDLNPAYCSVLVKFDALAIDHSQVEAAVRALLDQTREDEAPAANEIEIPVLYGGEFGPDLEDVASLHGLTTAEAVRLHSDAQYTVCFLGFVPGFAYLGGLPEILSTPRLASPRKRVPPGSVAIGGDQAGVYPFPTPGGWRILGRTPLAMFQEDRTPASLLAIGDRVRFLPITAARFAELEHAGE